MKYASLMLIFLLAVTVNCSKENDETDIQELLESSWFIGDGSLMAVDDSTNTPGTAGTLLPGEIIPWVRWVRFIERPVTVFFDITVEGDSADVIIRSYFEGNSSWYGFFVRNAPGGPVYQRTIADSVVRKIKCFKDNTGWHIASLTPADIYTIDTDYPVLISEVRAEVSSRDYVFTMTSADTYFEKHQLPIFYPEDTVEVTVICSASDDSTWAFLHHGAGHRPGIGLRHHNRTPFERENTTTFTGTWIIANDSIRITPAVRHSAIDVLGWQTLFGDSLASYYTRAWCLPYIVLQHGEDIPEDIE